MLCCGCCGHRLTGGPHSGTYPDGTPRRQYHCHRGGGGCGRVAGDVRAVDRELRAFVMRRLSDPRRAAAIAAARAQVADRLTAVTTVIAECEAIGEAGSGAGRSRWPRSTRPTNPSPPTSPA
ncbi:MAG: hypothetical protein ACRDSL_13330 [Pseudonocardiaceae bacterium]